MKKSDNFVSAAGCRNLAVASLSGRSRLRFSLAVLGGAAGLALSPATAATVTWTAPSSTNLFGTNNWNPSGVPTTSDEVVFSSVPNPQLVSGNNLTWGNLIWNTATTGSMEIGSGAGGNRLLTLSGGGGGTTAIAAGGAAGDLLLLGDNATSGTTLTIFGAPNPSGFRLFLQLGANGNFNVKNAGATLAIATEIRGDYNLTKTGAGTLTLGAASAFGAGTTFTVAEGVVNANHTRSLRNGNVALSGGVLVVGSEGVGSVTVQAGQSFTMDAGTLRLSFDGVSNHDQILGSDTGAFSITGGILDLTNSISDYSVSYTILGGFGSGAVEGLSFVNYDSANYTATLGADGVLSFTPSVIPEPSACAALAGALALGLSALRRRRRD